MPVDGYGNPIPPGSWGGDLDPMRGSTCCKCGTPIPFGKFCQHHLAEARQQNAQLAQQRQAQAQPTEQSLAPADPPRAEVDFDALAAQEYERVRAIMTSGEEIPKSVDHLSKSLSGPGAAPAQPALTVVQAIPQGAQSQGLDALIFNQGMNWLDALRAFAEEKGVSDAQRREITKAIAELLHAMASR